jgi:hypothetical protein
MFESFAIHMLSIILEAMPFVFLGTFLSSLIEIFISPEKITQWFSQKKWYYYLLAGLIGIIMPICECAIVPIMRRLVKKGVPIGVAITFLLATPIVNPVVLLSTYYAFSGDWAYVLGRGGLGFIGAVIIGILMGKVSGTEQVLKETSELSCSCGHDHNHIPDHHTPTFARRVHHILSHMSSEFIEVSKYLILGATIAAIMQTFVSRQWILGVGNNIILSSVFMIILAYVLSLCSEADAFIAATFRNLFPDAAIMAFLISGPMIDIKNTLMLLEGFKKTFVIRLTLYIGAFSLLLGLIFNLLIS